MISLTTWSHPAWTWLHGGNMTPQVLAVLPEILPCTLCGTHMTAYLQEHPVPSSGLVAYIHTFHNAINVRNNKPVHTQQPLYTQREVRAAFHDFLFVVLSTAGPYRRPSTQERLELFISLGYTSIGIDPPLVYARDGLLMHQVFTHSPTHTYTSFQEVLDKYVPSHLREAYQPPTLFPTGMVIGTICICLLAILFVFVITRIDVHPRRDRT